MKNALYKQAPAGNGLISNSQLRDLVIAKRGKKTLTKYAAELGVSFQFLGKVLQGEYLPGPTIAKNLGYEQVITYSFRRSRKKARKPEKKARAARA
jgi:hypothetical protein